MANARRSGPWRPTIGQVIGAIALLPLAGLVWFTVQTVSTAAAQRRDADQVVARTDELIDGISLATALSEEMYWRHAVNGLSDIAADRPVVVEMTGIDPWTELDRAAATVDHLLLAGDDPGLETELAEYRDRGSRDTIEVTAGFDAVIARMRAAHQEEVRDLLALASSIPGTGELTFLVRALEIGDELRDNIDLQLGAFFGSQFAALTSPEEETRDLVVLQGRYQAGLATLERMAARDGRLADALKALGDHPGVARFTIAVEAHIETVLGSGTPATALSDLQPVAADPGGYADDFTAGVTATHAHVTLVGDVASMVTGAATQLSDSAADRTLNAVLVALLICVAALTAAAGATRAIIDPLRRLAEGARAITQGSVDVRVAESGTAEVAATARAMNEALAQLGLFEKQAQALAYGAIEDPVLTTELPGPLGQSLQQAVTALATSFAEGEHYRQRLAHDAAHDGLTGLPNRSASLTHLGRALARAQRSGTAIATLFVDLDGFKAVNDHFGHPVGDRFLAQVARRLADAVREGDLVGRFGGDEFIVVAEPVTDEEEALALASRLLAALAEPVAAAGRSALLGASVGVALSNPEHKGPDDLIHDADLAVYRAKQSGRGRVVLCDAGLRRASAARSEVEAGLARAIVEGELVVNYQLLVDSQTEKPTSMEALVRWRRPDGELIPPDDFIPIAERSELIVELDRWMLGAVAQQLALWSEQLGQDGMSVAVNLSERHLAHPELVEHVLSPLRDHGVDPQRLTLEVTESALLDDPVAAAAQLHQLRSYGIQIALDDFGTGYSSIAHLRALPIDVLKIDRSYISNMSIPDERSLIKMMIDISHLFGLRVVAEGVETRSQADDLVALGADALQGYYFARPAAAADLA